MKKLTLMLAATAALFLTAPLPAQVPNLLNYQGRVTVGSVNFNGTGQFKFALVSAGGATTYWSNDGTSTAGSPPAFAVNLTVTKGLYSVLLGDTTLANMTIIPLTVFDSGDVRLRVWFNDGTNGFQLLSPDQRIAPNGYLASGATGSLFPAGGVIAFAGTAAPGGWLFCDGSAVSRATYPALFTAIGTAHGNGDGSTTFNLPDYRGRFLRGLDGGTGRDPDAAGRTAMNPGGSTSSNVGTVQADQLAAHTHSYTIAGLGAAANVFSSSYPTNTPSTTQTGSTGGNETRPKNASVNYLIKY